MYAVKFISTAWKEEGKMYAVKLYRPRGRTNVRGLFKGVTDRYLTDKFTRFGRVTAVEIRNKKYRAYLVAQYLQANSAARYLGLPR